MEALHEFRNHLEQAGLRPGEVAPDGILRRCPTADRPKSKNGAYQLFEDGRGGWYENHADGKGPQAWQAKGAQMDRAERRRLQKEIEKAKAAREQAEAERHEKAAEEARKTLEGLPSATAENPYLKRKGVPPCPGLRMDGETLVVSVWGEGGKVISLQRIEPDGSKKFMPGGRTKGGYFVVKGDDGPLYLAEGLATALSVYQATGATVLVAFNSGNLEAVALMARRHYLKREIIICGDDDAETEARTGMNPGRKAAEAAARAVKGKICFPTFKGEEGTDFNDMASEQGLEAVKAALANSKLATIAGGTPENWKEPMPVGDARLTNEPYPVDALPGTIKDAVSEVAEFVQAPVEMVALSALSAVSTVVQGLYNVRRAGKLEGPTSLFTLAVADSGERKSTLDSFFSKAIRDWERDRAEAMKPELAAFDAAFGSWEARRGGLLNAIKEAEKRGKPVRELEDRLTALERERPERPKVPRLLVMDSTTEALTWRLAKGWPVAGVLSSEGGLVFGAYSMGKDAVMRNLATLNALWGGEPLSIDRRTTECFSIRSARLTVGIAVQPETITRFIDSTRGLARGSGFLARFLVAMPESRQGRRPFKEPPEHWPSLSRFHRRLGALLDSPLNFNHYGELSPSVLELSPEARAIWIDFHNEVEAELLPGGEMVEAKDVASKGADNAARLAALFHCFEQGPSGTIGPEFMAPAARVIAWHLFEALRFLGELALPLELANAARLDSWLIEYCGRNRVKEVTTTTCLQYGPLGTRRRRFLDTALFELEDAGRIRQRTEGRKLIIEVNPELL